MADVREFEAETPVVEIRLANIEASLARIEDVLDVLMESALPLLKGKTRTRVLALMMARVRG